MARQRRDVGVSAPTMKSAVTPVLNTSQLKTLTTQVQNLNPKLQMTVET